MAYTERARELRRCRALTAKNGGQPCQRYAVWGDELGRCATHGGRVLGPHIAGKTAAPGCTCAAYSWPHRPGGGLCRWPDAPQYRLTAPAGKHALGYKTFRKWGWAMGWRRGLMPAHLAYWWQEGRYMLPRDRAR